MVKIWLDVDMSKIHTKELVRELGEREGVERHDYANETADEIGIKGPCIVLIVID